MKKEKLLKVDEAAVYLREISGLNINTGSLNRWRLDRKGPSYQKIGGVVRYTPDALDAFLRDSLVRIEKQTRVRAPRQTAAAS